MLVRQVYWRRAVLWIRWLTQTQMLQYFLNNIRILYRCNAPDGPSTLLAFAVPLIQKELSGLWAAIATLANPRAPSQLTWPMIATSI